MLYLAVSEAQVLAPLNLAWIVLAAGGKIVDIGRIKIDGGQCQTEGGETGDEECGEHHRAISEEVNSLVCMANEWR